MQKIKTFFYSFYKSTSSPKYYSDILKTKLGFSIKYLLALAILASLVSTTFSSIKSIPKAQRGINSLISTVRNAYPSDLVITIKSGSWTINRPEPFTVPLPKTSRSANAEGIENIIVFYKQGTIDDLTNFKTIALVNSANVLIRSGTNGSISNLPISSIKDTVINSILVNSILDKINKYFQVLPYFLPIFIFFGLMMYYFVIRGIYLFGVALLIYIFAKLNKKPLKYMDAYRIGIHTMTIPLIIEVILEAIGFGIPIPFGFMLLNILPAVFVVTKLEKNTIEEALPPTLNVQN